MAMSTRVNPVSEGERRFVLHGVTWSDYLAQLKIVGDRHVGAFAQSWLPADFP